ncbi:MAG: DUF2769 domain-containing protein [Halobacteriota archaeon]
MRVPDTEANYNMCMCYGGDCPTYNDSDLSGGLFCSRGKSDKQVEKSDCICPDCPVQVQYDLTDIFYCDEGAAKD